MTASDIVLVRFPFANLKDSKKRPALVLMATKVSARAEIVTVAMITSRVEGLGLAGDVELADWKKASLLHPSLVRLGKVATIDGELIEKRLGKLSAEDQQRVKKTFRKVFSAWVSS